MRSLFSKIFVLIVFLNQVCLGSDFRSSEERKSVEKGQSEFFNSNKDHRFENKVNFVGGVQVPGIYHLPDTANLVEAIALAGGTTLDADLSKVMIKRSTDKGMLTYRFDLSEMVSRKDIPFPALSDKDTVLIEENHPAQKTIVALSIASLALGLLTTSYLLIQNKK